MPRHLAGDGTASEVMSNYLAGDGIDQNPAEPSSSTVDGRTRTMSHSSM